MNTASSLDAQRDLAIGQIEFARKYTLATLEGLPDDDWFRMADGVTHVAWQVGHLAMAEYALTMLRIRGKEPEDQELMPNAFFRRFKKGSQPAPPGDDHPAPHALLAALDRVHRRALEELSNCSDAVLLEPLPEPFAVHANKLGSLLFCSKHEMLHAGQIGLLRRLLGHTPVRG